MIIKSDKILLSLVKNKKEDNFFSLFKTKTIGGSDSDWSSLCPNEFLIKYYLKYLLKINDRCII